jgi:glucosamine--fructose-6-phosphate aminotransferase (isomerizing)
MNVAGFRSDVLREPETLAALAAAYLASDGPLAAVPGGPPPRRIVFTGMGSSRFAALSIARWLRARGIDSHVEYASARLTLPPAPDVLCVAISSSGASDETVEALQRHAGTSRTIAVTNHPERALGMAADVVLPLLAGEETGGVACTSYQCTLAVLLLLAARLADDGPPAEALAGAVEAGAHLRDSREQWLPAAVELLGGGDAVDVIGPDERIAAVQQSALMFREGPRIRSAACETGDWLHVDVYLSKHPGYRALLLSGSAADAGVMEWARERESTIVAVGQPVVGSRLDVTYPRADEPLVALLSETMVAELVAAELWGRRTAQ